MVYSALRLILCMSFRQHSLTLFVLHTADAVPDELPSTVKKSGHRFRHKNITNHIGRIVVKSNKLDLTTPRSQSSPHIFKEWYLITHIHFIFKINKYQKKFTTTFSFHVPLDMNYNAEQPIPISPIAYKTRPFHVAHLLWNHSAIGFKITS